MTTEPKGQSNPPLCAILFSFYVAFAYCPVDLGRDTMAGCYPTDRWRTAG